MSQGSYYGLPSQGCFSLSEEPEKVRPPTLLGFEHFDISTSHHPSLSGEEKWPRESYSEVLHCCEAEPRVELELNEKKTCPTLMEWYVSNKYCGWLMDHKETPPPPPSRWTHHLVILLLLFFQGILLFLLTVPTVSTMSFLCFQAVPSAKTGPIIINSAPLNENTFRRFRPCSDSVGRSTILSDYWRKVSPPGNREKCIPWTPTVIE